MDFITQVALGGVIGHTVANTKVKVPLGKKGLFAGAILGALPDADVLINFGNDVNNFIYHRSFSHSIFILLALSFLLFFITKTYFKHQLKVHKFSHTRLFMLISLPLLTHPLLDSFTVYGTQLFWPFFTDLSDKSPESWSTLFIIDPLYSLPLFIAIGYALFKPEKVKTSHIALIFSCLYLMWSVMAKSIIDRKVINLAEKNSIYNPKYMTTPTPFNTLLWRTVIMSEEYYYVAYINIFNMKKSILSMPIRHNHDNLKPQKNISLHKIKWFTNGFYRLDIKDHYVIATDLRMGIEQAYIFQFAIAKNVAKANIQSDITYNEKEIPFKINQNIKLTNLKKIYKHF